MTLIAYLWALALSHLHFDDDAVILTKSLKIRGNAQEGEAILEAYLMKQCILFVHVARALSSLINK